MLSILVMPGIIALAGLLIFTYQYFRKKHTLLSLPPGPKPLPIVGNILDFPPPGTPEFQHWLKFKDLYGPISSVTVFGQTIILLHDKEATHDLMEKMSIKTSGRPQMVFADELCGLRGFLSNKQYGETFRLHRKLVHQQIGTRAHVARFNNILDIESRWLLQQALDDPKNVLNYFRTETGAIILKIVYGYSIEPNMADPLVTLVEGMMANFSRAMIPLTWFVDMVPALRYLPEEFPGAAFKKTARKWRAINHKVVDIPFTFVRQQMANGTHRPSYVSSLIEQFDSGNSENRAQDFDTEDAIKWSAAVMYGGAADTTVSTLNAFLLAMVMFPEAQHKAQKEIDCVIGIDRLPQFQDRERLPYTSALIKEALRWFPILPLNPAHAADQEIIYRGYRIPKGSYLIASTWWFLHDPQVYPEPLSFQPERFLEPRNEPDPTEGFGWGRRICPGQFVATDSLFITITRMLATFNIGKAVDEQGREIEPKFEYKPGLISRPMDFPFSINPRSERHVELIRPIKVDYPEKGDADLLDFGLGRGSYR